MRILPRDEKFYELFTELAIRLTASATLLHEMFKSPGELQTKVSTIKELVRRWYPETLAAAPDKKGGHRALDDIKESLDELRYYRRSVFRAP